MTTAQHKEKENIHPKEPENNEPDIEIDQILTLKKYHSSPIKTRALGLGAKTNPRLIEKILKNQEQEEQQNLLAGNQGNLQLISEKTQLEKQQSTSTETSNHQEEQIYTKDEKNQLIQESKEVQQQYLQQNQDDVFQKQIKNKIIHYSKDLYNKFIIISILESRNYNHIIEILTKFQANIKQLSEDQFAYKTIQAALQFFKFFRENVKNSEKKEEIQKLTQQQIEKIESLNKFFFKYILENTENSHLSTHQYGNYLVSTAIETFDKENLQKLIKILDQNMLQENQNSIDLCSNQYGCLMIQKLIESYKLHKDQSSEIQKTLTSIMERISNKAIPLSKQQYSNYVIQKLIENGDEQYKQQIVQEALNNENNNFLELCKDKYGSNVIEAIIKNHESGKVYAKLMSLPIEQFTELINHQFSNYIVQTLYKECKQNNQKNNLYKKVQNLELTRQLTQYGNKVLLNMVYKGQNQQYYQQYNQYLQQNPNFFQQYPDMNLYYQYPNMQYFPLQQFQQPLQYQNQQLQQQQFYPQQQQMYYQYNNNNINPQRRHKGSLQMIQNQNNQYVPQNQNYQKGHKNYANRKKKYSFQNQTQNLNSEENYQNFNQNNNIQYFQHQYHSNSKYNNQNKQQIKNQSQNQQISSQDIIQTQSNLDKLNIFPKKNQDQKQ